MKPERRDYAESQTQPSGRSFDMKYHLVYASECEHKVLEIETDDVPPNRGDTVQLPFGENKEMRPYCAADVYYTPVSQEMTIFYIDVKPA